MQRIRPLGPADKAEVAADLNGLPHALITELDGAAHVFTAGLAELEQWASWFMPLGARITHHPTGPGVVLWTLHATLGDVYPTPVRVHALALDTEQIDADIANAAA
jgi:hypothetical protein